MSERVAPMGQIPAASGALAPAPRIWGWSRTTGDIATAPVPLPDPPEDVNAEVAKIALEQVNKRFESQLSLKTSTEARALTLATNCVTILSFVTGGVFVEATHDMRLPLMVGGSVAICLLSAVVFSSYMVIRPSGIALPGRNPAGIWGDVIDSQLKAGEFAARLMQAAQIALVENQMKQQVRAKWLNRAIRFAFLTAPVCIVGFIVAQYVFVILYFL
jgi:hypothetical protein